MAYTHYIIWIVLMCYPQNSTSVPLYKPEVSSPTSLSRSSTATYAPDSIKLHELSESAESEVSTRGLPAVQNTTQSPTVFIQDAVSRPAQCGDWPCINGQCYRLENHTSVCLCHQFFYGNACDYVNLHHVMQQNGDHNVTLHWGKPVPFLKHYTFIVADVKTEKVRLLTFGGEKSRVSIDGLTSDGSTSIICILPSSSLPSNITSYQVEEWSTVYERSCLQIQNSKKVSIIAYMLVGAILFLGCIVFLTMACKGAPDRLFKQQDPMPDFRSDLVTIRKTTVKAQQSASQKRTKETQKSKKSKPVQKESNKLRKISVNSERSMSQALEDPNPTRSRQMSQCSASSREEYLNGDSKGIENSSCYDNPVIIVDEA